LAKTLWGESICPTFRSGHKSSLAKHPRSSLNAPYVLHSVVHRGGKTEYRNSFTAFPAGAAFRPRRTAAKPRIHGTQTAKVVGKSGEEIWTDQYGRVKV
jgi:type VI secretion system secreted protein VgrG